MPTALVRTYTGDAFVVAADGRVCNSATGTVTNESMQKLFQLGKGPLAYCFTGAARLGRADCDDSSEVLFDFIAELRNASHTISAGRYPTLQRYSEKLSSSIYRGLKEAHLRGNIELPDIAPEDSEGGRTIVDIYLDGYFSGIPSRVKIRFWHDRQHLSEPEVTTCELMPMTPAFHGIPEIAKLVSRNDSSLSHYMVPLDFDSEYNESVTTAVIASRAFIQACAGPEGAKINPKASAEINGYVHMVVITPQDGFQWVPGFDPGV
jgi:hypothetical protein